MASQANGRITAIARMALPRNAVVAVAAAEGDPMPDLDGRETQPLPLRDDDPEGEQAASALEELRARGCDFLLVAGPALGRFERRRALVAHLQREYRPAVSEPECVIFGIQLSNPEFARLDSEDGLPLPPPEVLRLVAFSQKRPKSWPGYYGRFLESGARGVRSIRAIVARAGVELEELGSILDFGCGCGRVMRHWRGLAGPELRGCDYNPYLVRWCQANLPFAAFDLNTLQPELPYDDDRFDLLYAISIFTHLDETLQLPWMSELTRVVKPGGLLLLSFSGQARIHELGAQERERFEAGELVVRHAELAGTNACSAYHPERYVRETLAAGLGIVDLVPDGAEDVHQDALLLKKPPPG
jgi:SAM-dependent methyltransferase